MSAIEPQKVHMLQTSSTNGVQIICGHFGWLRPTNLLTTINESEVTCKLCLNELKRREIKKSQGNTKPHTQDMVTIYVTREEKKQIRKMAKGNMSKYLLNLHKDFYRRQHAKN